MSDSPSAHGSHSGNRVAPFQVDALSARAGSFGCHLIANERLRQLSKWAVEHDDAHTRGEMVLAAICYGHAALIVLSEETEIPNYARETLVDAWPWEVESWQPSENDPIDNLKKAGALIAAEIDRLEREANPVKTDAS
jgi:hypothetical protein